MVDIDCGLAVHWLAVECLLCLVVVVVIDIRAAAAVASN